MISLLEEALQFEQHREDNKNIYFKKDGIFFAKKMQDIVYIKSSAGKMLVKTVRDSLEISYKSNSQVLRELDSENFIKCNRAVVVNKSLYYAEGWIWNSGDWNDHEKRVYEGDF